MSITRRLSAISFGFLCLMAVPSRGHAAPEVCKQVRSVVKPGDVIFTQIGSYPFALVAEATNTWASHIGIVLPNPEGRLVVYESTFPLSKTTSICDFIKRSTDEKLVVKRLKSREYTFFEIARLKFEAENRLGVFYNRLFRYKRQSTTFCSKYVYQVYLNALGIELGKLETFQEVLDNYRGPNREEVLAKFKEYFVIGIPWQEQTITPASQLLDPKFETIFEHENTESPAIM